MRYDKPDLNTSLAKFTYNGQELPGEPISEEFLMPGSRIRLGTREKIHAPVFWNPEDARHLTTPNIAVVGGNDMDNSQMIQSIALQLLRQKSQSGEPIDLLLFDGLDGYNESRTSFVDTIGARVIRLHKLPLNPFNLRDLERKPQLHTHSAMAFADSLARAYDLGSLQKSILVQSIVAAYAAKGISSDPLSWDLPAPTLEDVYEEYNSRPRSQRSDDLDRAMESLALLDLFDCETPEDLPLYDRIQGPVILDMSGYPDAAKHFALSVLLEILFAQMRCRERTVGHNLRKMILIDNVDFLLSAGCPGLEGLLSQGRDFGLGLLLAAHSLDVFQEKSIDCLKWIPAWILHNVEDLRKKELEILLQMDIHDSSLERLYQESRRLRHLHSLICLSGHEPVLAEDLPFYEIVGDTAQSYLLQTTVQEPEPLAGMPLLDSTDPDTLVTLDEEIPGLMDIFEGL